MGTTHLPLQGPSSSINIQVALAREEQKIEKSHKATELRRANRKGQMAQEKKDDPQGVGDGEIVKPLDKRKKPS